MSIDCLKLIEECIYDLKVASSCNIQILFGNQRGRKTTIIASKSNTFLVDSSLMILHAICYRDQEDKSPLAITVAVHKVLEKQIVLV